MIHSIRPLIAVLIVALLLPLPFGSVFAVKPSPSIRNESDIDATKVFDLKISGIAQVPDTNSTSGTKDLHISTIIDSDTKFGSYTNPNGQLLEKNSLTAGFAYFGTGFLSYYYTEVEDVSLVNWINVTGSVLQDSDGTYSFSIYAFDDLAEFDEYFQMFLKGKLAKDKMTADSLEGIIAFENSALLTRCDIRTNSNCYPDYSVGTDPESSFQLEFGLDDSHNAVNYLDGATYETRISPASLEIIQNGTAEVRSTSGFLTPGTYDVTLDITSPYLVRLESGQARVLFGFGFGSTSLELSSDENNVFYDVPLEHFKVGSKSVRYSLDNWEQDDGFLTLKGNLVFPDKIDFLNTSNLHTENGRLSIGLVDFEGNQISIKVATDGDFIFN